MKQSTRTIGRLRRKERIAKKIRGTSACPRLSVFRSNKHIDAQLIDDLVGNTLVAASTKEKELKGPGTLATAKEVGNLIAKRAIAKGVKAIVFDRAGFRFHGQVKALAEGARQGGLKF